MTPEKQIEVLTKRIDKLESILFGISNDVRFQAKIRAMIFTEEHTTDKPTIVNSAGKRYNLQTV